MDCIIIMDDEVVDHEKIVVKNCNDCNDNGDDSCNNDSCDTVCYLLASDNPKHPNATYVGVTNDLYRRIQQHNGELTGGAKRTARKRPWRVVGYYSGFPDRKTALQFEWRVHHPPNCRKIKSKRGKTIYRYPSGYYGITGRQKIFQLVLNMKRWTSTAPMTSTMNIKWNTM